MKSTTISYTNKKGQIVIPKEYRDQLEINEEIALLLKFMGNSIVISPIESISTRADKESSYSDILAKTKGKWGKTDSKQLKKIRQKNSLELKASKERRKAW